MSNKGTSRNKGEANPFFGKKHTLESLEKMSLAHKGKKRPPRTAEWSRKISEAKKGKMTGNQNPFFGKHHTEETKKMIGQKELGHTRQTKDRHWNWQGGITNPRKSEEEKRWSLAVRRRDKFTCQKCGVKSTRQNPVEAHHIKPFTKYPKLRFDLSNGTTLCVPCHQETDTFGGKKKCLN